MAFDKKEITQTTGDNSQNIHDNNGHITIINSSLTEKQLAQIVKNISQEVFPTMLQQFSDSIKQNFENLLYILFERAHFKHGEAKDLEKIFYDPEKSFVILDALQTVVKRNNRADTETLSHLLINKIINDDDNDDEKGLILNQSIEASSKLSKTHVFFLGYIYFIKHVDAQFYGIPFNNIKHYKKYTVKDQAVYIGNDIPIQIQEIWDRYTDLYTFSLEHIFQKSIGEGALKKVNISYLEHVGCLTKHKGLSRREFSYLLQRNTGVEISSALGKEKFPLLNSINSGFGFNDFNDLDSIILSPIGEVIGQTFYKVFSQNK